jgi:hypothetical protein
MCLLVACTTPADDGASPSASGSTETPSLSTGLLGPTDVSGKWSSSVFEQKQPSGPCGAPSPTSWTASADVYLTDQSGAFDDPPTVFERLVQFGNADEATQYYHQLSEACSLLYEPLSLEPVGDQMTSLADRKGHETHWVLILRQRTLLILANYSYGGGHPRREPTGADSGYPATERPLMGTTRVRCRGLSSERADRPMPLCGRTIGDLSRPAALGGVT